MKKDYIRLMIKTPKNPTPRKVEIMTRYKNLTDVDLLAVTISLQGTVSRGNRKMLMDVHDEIIFRLSPAEKGILQVAIDDSDHLGDDWTVDNITGALIDSDIGIHSDVAADLAYHIVHNCRRKV